MKHNTDDVFKAVADKHGVSETEVRETLLEVVKPLTNDSESSEVNLERFLKDLADDAQENRMKLLCARDVILVHLMNMDFSVEESVTVLQMCRDEINAWEKRSEFDVM